MVFIHFISRRTENLQREKKKNKFIFHDTCIHTFLVTPDVYVSLRGKNYSNNSLVTLTEIGDNRTTALICHTNITSCCNLASSTFSEWKYPGRTRVKLRKAKNELFTRDRGNRTIFLYRKEDTLGPIGIYSCEINDSLTNTAQELQVGIYPIDKGN